MYLYMLRVYTFICVCLYLYMLFPESRIMYLYMSFAIPKKKTRWKKAFQRTNSGGGEQSLLLDCRAQASTKFLRV